MGRLVLLVVLACGVVDPAAAAPLRLVTGPDYPPLADPALSGGGLAVRIVRAAYEAAGQPVEIVFRPWQRAYEATRSGRFAATFPFTRTLERNKAMTYSGAILRVGAKFVSRRSDPLRVAEAGIAAVRGRSFCRPTGYSYPGKLGRLIDSGAVRVQSAADLQSCAELVGVGRADFFAPNSYRWRYMQRVQGVDGAAFHVAPAPIGRTGLFAVGARRYAAAQRAIRELNEGLAALKASGRYGEMLAAARGERASGS